MRARVRSTSWGRGDFVASRRKSSLPTSCTSRPDSGEPPSALKATAQIPAGTSIYDALRLSLELLEGSSIPEPDESVLHLLSHALDLDWDSGYRQLREVMTSPEPFSTLAQQTLTSEQTSAYNSLLNRRLQFEPLQYIIGQWDFHYLTGLQIRKPMLCPRPETEELVEFVLADVGRMINGQNMKAGCERKIRILDVGCGTGAIGIAIANRYPEHVQVVALDVLAEAVELSNENARKFLSGASGGDCINIYDAILCSANDFTNDTTESQQKYEMGFDIVVSNPPYIPTKDMQDLSTDVVGYESQFALCGGDDGLEVIRDIVSRLPEWVSSTRTRQQKDEERYCWMEVDDSHPSMMEKWLAPGSEESERWGVQYCSGYKDFCGRDRFVKLKVL